MTNSPAARAARLLLALVPLTLLATPAPAQESAPARPAWSPEVVELAESLPVQDGGRIKPLRTQASFTLLRLSGRRSVRLPSGERLSATEWLLDVLLYPELADTYPVFLVQNAEVVEAIAVSREGKKVRDRYSFEELRPRIDRLFQLAGEYHRIEEKDRTTVQQQVFLLAMRVQEYLGLSGHLEFARESFPVRPGGEISAALDGADVATPSLILEHLGPLLVLRDRLSAEAGDGAEMQALSEMLVRTSESLSRSENLALLPPAVDEPPRADWHSPVDVFVNALQGSGADAEAIEDLAGFERLAANRDDPAAFESSLRDLHGRLVGRAEARGEYEKVDLELLYYRSKILNYSHYGFVLAFFLTAFLWLRPRSKVLYGGTSLTVLVSTVLLIGTITLRCMIRGRPPVSTLYETVLFVTAVAALIAMFTEAVNRRRIAISVAALVGVIGLFIANGYEMLDKKDTMPSLVAVLDTNFWLATHVTAITTGYSAGMLAAVLASVYLVTKAFGVRRSDPTFHHSLGRMVYGVLCFALIFSTVGTILGGIWANDSWGRFWGWDPKENGALLIVLSQLVILHARMGGYLREHGLCMATAFGGTVIAFSWWGVNLLGVGLHSYGFTSGIHDALWTYYGLQWAVVGLGAYTWLRERGRARDGRTDRSRSVNATGERPEALPGQGSHA